MEITMKQAALDTSTPSKAGDAGVPDALPLVGRLLLAAIFVISGLNKATDPAGTIGYITSAGLPLPQVAFAGAVFVETVGGILLVIGYQTRIVAAVLAAFTLAAAFSFHFDLADQNQFIHFMKNVALAGGLLQVIAFGPGRYSFDRSK
jgi:putative oxidoreductase